MCKELEHVSKEPKNLIWIQDIATNDIIPLTTHLEVNHPECKYELGPGKKEIVGLYCYPNDAYIYEYIREFYDRPHAR